MLHDITMEEYYRLYNEQNGLCAICGKPESQKMKGKLANLAVDHDHKTGKVRGLLCFKCNTRLGALENEAFFTVALAYLEKHK
jgi:translation initiation factor 2 beta subunit (eIF-2beta)/eIF-5